MKYYRVFIRGDNFILDMDGEPSRVGFYTTRFVQAKSAAGAEVLAVDLIRHDKKLRGVHNLRSDPPLIFAEKISEVSTDDVPDIAAGYAFFPAESRNEA